METKPKKTIAPRVDMPCQPADVRAHNFDEVATGYTKEMAMQEAYPFHNNVAGSKVHGAY